MSMTQWCMLCGAISCGYIILLVLQKTRGIDKEDVGNLLAAFTAGAGIPKGIFICYFCFTRYEQLKTTDLNGYEIYLVMAGIALLAAAFIAIGSCIKKYK